MSHRILKTGALLVAISALALGNFPSLIANADDLSWSSDDTGGFAGGNAIMPAIQPSGGGVVLPQFGAADAPTTVPVLPGANPFARVPVVAPAAASAPLALPAGNPFAPAANVAPGMSAVPDAKPFALTSPDAAATPDANAPVASKTVDESALRYYASQRDLPRVGAEIRRLKALYPDWEPPVDLFTPSSMIDEQPLWNLFAAGQLVAERAKIAELKAANPNWVPSDDLMNKLGDAETRQAMRIAYTAANWQQVIAAAQSRNSVLVCPQIETLWELAEAFARVRDFASSFDVYQYVLTNCSNPDERLSTVQKAATLLPAQGIASLVAMGRPRPDGTLEFDSIGFNGIRDQLNAAINDSLNASPVSPTDLERFAAYVQTTRLPSDIGLIGWYYYSQEEWKAAYAWFTVGARSSKDPKFLEGQLLSLRSGGQTADALKLANSAKSRSPELTKEYIELVAAVLTDPEATITFSSQEKQVFEDTVSKTKSALGAQAVGWTYLNDDNLSAASEWFNDSMDWGVTEGGVIGQAVVASRLKQYGTLSTLKAKYTEKFPGLEKFKVYKVKSKSTYGKSKTQSSIDCKDRKALTLFALLACS